MKDDIQQRIKTELDRIIHEFEFATPSGEHFWAPYTANRKFVQDKTVPRGMGKAYPSEIRRAIAYVCLQNPDISAEELRDALVEGNLDDPQMNYRGVDCSGFVYIVFEKLFDRLYGTAFSDILALPKADVVNGGMNYEEWRAAHPMTQEEADALPEDVQVSWVAKTFNRKPVNLCRVSGIVSDFTSQPVALDDIRIGDLIHMTNELEAIPHIAIVYGIYENKIKIVHSTRKIEDDPGGITFDVLLKIDGKLDARALVSPIKKPEIFGIRRLRGM
jgi:hypothetical protein